MAVLLLVAAAGAGCKDRDLPAPASLAAGPDQVLHQFERTESKVGTVQLVLDAARGDVYDREKRVELVNMRVDFFSREGEHLSTLTGDSGHVDTRTEDMEAFGHVRVVGEDGAVLTTTRLAWADKAGEIRTREPVTIHRGTDEVRGRGFQGEPSLKTFRLLDQVQAEVSGDEVRREDARADSGAQAAPAARGDSGTAR